MIKKLTPHDEITDELKPCPFCSGRASLHLINDKFVVYCDNCMSTTEFLTRRDLAIKAWNKRSQISNPKVKKGKSSDKLKSCPFCGSKATLYVAGSAKFGILVDFFISCNNCSASTNFSENKERVIKTWNRRSFSAKEIRKSIRRRYRRERRT